MVIVQGDAFEALDSVAICPLTTIQAELPLFRLEVIPTEANGLRAPSRIMIDKVSAVPKAKLGGRIGRIADADILRVNRALATFLGLAG